MHFPRSTETGSPMKMEAGRGDCKAFTRLYLAITTKRHWTQTTEASTVLTALYTPTHFIFIKNLRYKYY